MFYLILAVVSFFSLMLIFGLVFNWDDGEIGTALGFSFIISIIILFITAAIKTKIDDNNCLEKNVTIVPKIIYTSDSSRKILQYNYENKVREIELKKDNSDYFIPESLLLIEPCEHKIRIKKEN